MERDDLGRVIREQKPLEGVRKVIAERMTYSKHTYPQGTGQVLLQVDNLMKFRKELLEKKGVKVSFGNLYLKAAACALEENMILNGSRTKTELIYYDDINLNATASINGILMEPVLEHADRKDIEEINEEIIMGISRNRRVPGFDENGNVVPVNMTSFALTVDHGFVDGIEVVNFFESLNKVLQDPWTWMYHKRMPAQEE